MDCWKVIKVGHKLKLKRIGGSDAEAAPEEHGSKMVIRHKIRVKPPKYLKKLLNFWL